MTVCFFGCDYKYETEAVLKQFLPLESFGFEYGSVPDGDHIIISVSGDVLEAEVSVGGRIVKKNSVHSDEYTDEAELSRMLFKSLSEITGITPKWGCLTGIRPVRKINALSAKGLDKSGIFAEMKKSYFTSDEKLELAYLTSVTQKKALDELGSGTYSLYIAIPFCPSRCRYCSFVSHSIASEKARALIPQYTEKLCGELEAISSTAEKLGLVLDTIYIGGGTPTAMPAGELEKIMKKTAECFDISRVREYTAEAGRADSIDEEKLEVIKKYGATRISVNPQTMIDSVLAAAGREHTAEQFVKCFELARSMGFDNINTDVIAGLPTDTAEGFRYTIDALADMSPEAVTVHTLTVKRSADLFSESDKMRDEVSPETVDDMVSYAFRKLTAENYSPYYLYRQKNTVGNLENVGYARAGYESLYNIYIMEEIQSILAAGASASTKLVGHGRIKRVMNYKYPYEYIKGFDEMIRRKSEITDFFREEKL
ncbi:MAG: coproporphyrinogen dehydrogenase HemZ [Oscillospiraceae bacterium]|nr:coproporphyrinogen dehydrogenase HemZ [Oscillospiraceae bacterium]